MAQNSLQYSMHAFARIKRACTETATVCTGSRTQRAEAQSTQRPPWPHSSSTASRLLCLLTSIRKFYARARACASAFLAGHFADRKAQIDKYGFD